MATPSPPRPNLTDAEIERIALGLLDRSLPAAEWTHAAHFAAALYLLRHRPEAATPEAMRRTISGYNLACGKENSDRAGYHHTITIASLRGAAAILGEGKGAPLSDVLQGLMASSLGRSDWLFAHWSPEVLFTPEARREWREPDRAPLPF